MSQKLHIALLVEHNCVKNFEYAIIEKIKKINGCEIVLIINHVNPLKSVPGFLFSIYRGVDKLVYQRGENHLAQVSLDSLNIQTISVKSVMRDSYDEFTMYDIQQIRKSNIDLILKFSTTVFKGELLSLPTYGIWEFLYGKKGFISDLAGVWETFNGNETIPVVLQKLPDKNNDGYDIEKHLASADPLSLFNNQNRVCWQTHGMMPRNVERLCANPEKFILEKSKNLIFFKTISNKYPTSGEIFESIIHLIYKNITYRLDRLFYKAQWSIYFSENESKYHFQRDISKFIKIETPKHLFWADPFVIDKDNKSYIFFEDYVYKTKKGHISVIVYDHKTKELSKPRVVIDTAYHQSYPFILEYEDEIYMIPEGSKDKDVKLYKAIDFPYKWEVVRTFFKGKEAVDMTLFFYESRWWLFTNMIEEQGQSLNEELYIFYCDDFRVDKWKSHKQNPVIRSVQTSRPAGKVIEYKGDFYRPSQNSVGSYGYSTNFNKIKLLTPSEYEEEFVSEITPDFLDNITAIHTYNSSQYITVVDVVHKIRRFFNK